MIRNQPRLYDPPNITSHLNENLIERNSSAQTITKLFQNGIFI